jgi:hypothetical protein
MSYLYYRLEDWWLYNYLLRLTTLNPNKKKTTTINVVLTNYNEPVFRYLI